MGQLSEVAMTMRNEDFMAMLQEANTESTAAFDYINRHNKYRNSSYTTIHIEKVEWDNAYEYVRFLRKYLNKVEHVFIRLGEEWDDTVLDFNGQDGAMLDCIGIIRKIDLGNAGDEFDLDFLNL